MRKERQIYTSESLTKLLTDRGIPFQEWGTGGTKSVQQLAEELRAGESELVVESRQLVRRYHVACIHVFGKWKKGSYTLSENRQVLRDGTIKRRNLPNAVSEKVIGDESPDHAAERGIEEELGLKVEVEHLHDTMSRTPSNVYPGLVSEKHLHWYQTTLKGKQFKAEGYVERQADKTTYFTWKVN